MHDRTKPALAGDTDSVHAGSGMATGPPEGWVLSLDLPAPGRLLAVLGDGHWRCEIAEAPWPPQGARALPDTTCHLLQRLGAARLSLQLRVALDDWPWEEELRQACPGLGAVPRYLTDSDDPATLWQVPSLLVSAGVRGQVHLALVRAARGHGRPLVLVDPALPASRRLALEHSLRSHWRGPARLSDALGRALASLGLPAACCRVYGDGRSPQGEPEQGRRPVTALSIDLVRSTQLLNTVGAEAYAQRLQSYHERCRDVIQRFQGSLDAPQGDDGFMAYFGFPVAVEDAATRALQAAWQLSRGMDDLGLQVRLGVASGQLAVSAQQAFGPEVHLAARLCGAAQPGEILVAPSTCERAGRGFTLAARPVPPLKDFGDLTEVYRLDAPGPAGGTLARPSAAIGFVGRHRELAALRDAWDAARAGRPRWCLVQGEAGIGKSRLLHEFSSGLRALEQPCLALAGQAHADNSPFAAVIDGLRQHWALDPGADSARLRGRLATLLPEGTLDGEGLDDLARFLVHVHGDDAAPEAGTQGRGTELLLACLGAVIGTGPFCLLVDDAHWLDPSSIELLRRLHEACGDRPLLVVLGERTPWHRSVAVTGAEPLELQGLSDAEARELALQAGSPLAEPVMRRVVERAGGVPLFLEESLRMLSGRDTGADGDVPATLEDLLMVRLDELGPDRALAQLVSVLGRECRSAHLDALLALDDPFVRRARQQGSLESLLASGLLQATDGPWPGYRFKHALIRDVAYGSIWTHDLRRLHGLCADLIERVTPGLWRERPEQLAQHLQAAGRPGPAQAAWFAAAQLSALRHAHQETVEHARRALALHDDVADDPARARVAMHLHLLVASAQIALQGYGSFAVEAAYQAAEQAGRRLSGAAHMLRIRLGLEACYVMRGDLARASALALTEAAASGWDGDHRLALQSRWALANVQFHQGDWDAALAGFDDCLAHYRFELHRRSGVQDPAVMCLGYSAWIHFELGNADEALRRIDRMLALAEALEHPFSMGVAHGFAASIQRLCGDVASAWPHALEAVRVCERGGFQVWLAHAWMVRGQLRGDRGEVAAGTDDMDRGYGLWVGSGARISCATYLATRAEVLLRQGLTRRAADDLAQAWRISEEIGEHYYQSEVLRLQGACAWQSGDTASALHDLQRAVALAEQQRKPGLVLRCAVTLGSLQAALGDPQAVARRVDTLLTALPGHTRSRDGRWASQALAAWSGGRPFQSFQHTPWEPR